MYVCMHACMHACMHVCMYVCMYVCIHPSTYPSIHQSIYLPVYLPIHLSIHLSIYLSISTFIIWQAPRAGKMNQIPRCDWLPKMERYCPLGIARFVPAITFCRSPSGCTKVFFRKIFSVTVIRFSVISLSGWN